MWVPEQKLLVSNGRVVQCKKIRIGFRGMGSNPARFSPGVRHVVEMVPDHRPRFLLLHRVRPLDRVVPLDRPGPPRRRASLRRARLQVQGRGGRLEVASLARKAGEVDGRAPLPDLLDCGNRN